jgi:calcium-dependent protein kinase
MGCLQAKQKRTRPEYLPVSYGCNAEETSAITLAIRPEAFISLNHANLLDEYEFTKVLGVGNYGKVQRAIHKSSGLVRAVKTINKAKVGKELRDGATYSNEINILRVMNHPNVLKMFEFYEDPVDLHIVTEYMAGGEFFDFVVETRYLSEPIAAHFFRQLISAVCYIHSIGVMHRDLKPENLLLDSVSPSATLKVIDFGTATFFTPGQKFTKQFGTAYYIAPEVLARSYNESCDMWSCGVILYILLCGRPPFNGRSESEIIESVTHGRYSLGAGLWSNVSSSAKDLISKLLQRNPDKRLTARQALDHEWIVNASRESMSSRAPLLTEVLISLGQFRVSQKLQHAVLTFIVTQTSNQKDMQELMVTFQKLDSNGDGRISREELLEEYERRMGAVEARQEVAWIMKQIDIDNSGYIEYSEFVMAVSKKEALVNRQNLELCFRSFDTDGNGKISSGELKAILENGIPTENDTWTQLIEEVDANKDGVIDLDEFKDMMMRFI